MFPTNPINALEASLLAPEVAYRRTPLCFQLIQLTHWKRAMLLAIMSFPGRRFQLIQLTHWKREMEMKAAAAFKKLFPTNPINALEASLSFRGFYT